MKIEIENIKDSFSRHTDEKDVSLDDYVRLKTIELGQTLENKKAIYLDQRYWIIIRDVNLGRITDYPSQKLFNIIHKSVSDGKAFCPISESVFIELLKQQDLHTRKATAEIIDNLSLGVTLAPEKIRVGTELANFFYSFNAHNHLYPLKILVWSKLSYVLGIVHPSNTSFNFEQELVLQKAFFDFMWNMRLTQLVDTLGDAHASSNNFNEIAEKINIESAIYSSEVNNFKQVYKNEMAGALSFYIDFAKQILEHMFVKNSELGTPRSDDGKICERELLGFLINLFDKTNIAKQLPTLHITTCCHTAVRWDKKRKLKGNDLYDFHHAAAALAYCDAFFTEKPLQSFLKQNHIALDRFFECEVISAVPEAVVYLKQI